MLDEAYCNKYQLVIQQAKLVNASNRAFENASYSKDAKKAKIMSKECVRNLPRGFCDRTLDSTPG